MKFKKPDAVRSNASSTAKAFPKNSSPLGSHVELQHLVVHDDEFRKRRIDNISNQLMACNNIWVYLDATKRVTDAAFNAPRDQLPPKYEHALHVVENAFWAGDWKQWIDQHKGVLDAAAPSKFS